MNVNVIAVIAVYVLFAYGTWWQYRHYAKSVIRLEQQHHQDMAAERQTIYAEANQLIDEKVARNDGERLDVRAENMRLRHQVEQLQAYAKDHVVFQAREYVSEEILVHASITPVDLEREIRHRLAGELANALMTNAVLKSWDEPIYRQKVVEMRVPIASFVPDEAMAPVPSPRWQTAAWYEYPRLIPPKED